MRLRASRAEQRNHRAGGSIEAGIRGWIIIIGVVLAIAIAAFAFSSPGGWRDQLSVAAVAIGLFLPATAVGVLAGFIFGLPRSQEPDTGVAGASSRVGTRFLVNSNLLKVSDWLTTILIGLALVQLGRLGPAVADLARALEPVLGGTRAAGVFGISMMLGLATVGAFISWLWTSIRVKELFEQADAVWHRIDQEGHTADVTVQPKARWHVPE